jgi:hypothetical protein
VICSIDLTEEELFHVLLLRHHGGVTEYPTKSTGPEETGQAKGNETPDSVSTPPTPNVTFNSPEPAAPTVAPVPLPPKQQRNRAKTNGAEAPINSTPLAPPEPAPLDEPTMRSLLSKVGAVHPLKVKAITDILETHGGRRRLSECDPATWPTIAAAAHDLLAEYGA